MVVLWVELMEIKKEEQREYEMAEKKDFWKVDKLGKNSVFVTDAKKGFYLVERREAL